MSYENAPATKLLATHCAICARPLVDAQSVELGIGPDCRKRHGYNVKVSPEARTEANQLVHEVAVTRQDPAVLAKALPRLRALGFEKLADVLTDRCAAVRVSEFGGLLSIATPFNEAAVAAIKSIPGRRWDGEKKVWTFPVTSRQQTWDMLRTHFAGALLATPTKTYVIPPMQPVTKPVQQTLRLAISALEMRDALTKGVEELVAREGGERMAALTKVMATRKAAGLPSTEEERWLYNNNRPLPA